MKSSKFCSKSLKIIQKPQTLQYSFFIPVKIWPIITQTQLWFQHNAVPSQILFKHFQYISPHINSMKKKKELSFGNNFFSFLTEFLAVQAAKLLQMDKLWNFLFPLACRYFQLNTLPRSCLLNERKKNLFFTNSKFRLMINYFSVLNSQTHMWMCFHSSMNVLLLLFSGDFYR